jgi:2-C-methyl-D-erythritol 4-phosphate cytidylyltransferase
MSENHASTIEVPQGYLFRDLNRYVERFLLKKIYFTDEESTPVKRTFLRKKYPS